MSRFEKIACICDFSSKSATDAFRELNSRYQFIDANSLDPEAPDVIIALGGDGLMLKVLHRYINRSIPIYGMNRGSVGFLLNAYKPNALIERLENSVQFQLHPLEMEVETLDGQVVTELAVNEVSMLRQTNQAAKIRISVDGEERIPSLVCDGVLVSTPAGSTAYNFAANGPIIPLGSNVLSVTPISPFRPRRWRGALLSHNNKILFEIIDPLKRPVSAVADFNEVRDVVSVQVYERKDIVLKLLFDKENNIQDRITKEQFMP
ncbi:MAG: inorganic polyphosphate/ATP-NAD kinase [Candidatus Midichloriaceae bacterium]|nr:inorganic polyphosphate/ATP-NAD kinase [Candidatus Midichloriaceae bacterium]